MTVEYWRDGEPADVTHEDWARTVPTFLGSGFRVRFPASPDHARTQAEAVAALFGTAFDQAPWEGLTGPHEVAGGWVYGLDRAWGPAWTAVRAVEIPEDGEREAIDLPWLWSSASPTARLPMISTLEADLAREHAGDRVGLWWDHRDLLCSTTAGPPLVEVDGAWHTPTDGFVTSGAYDDAARRLGATPQPLTRDLVASGTLLAVSDLGVETRLHR